MEIIEELKDPAYFQASVHLTSDGVKYVCSSEKLKKQSEFWHLKGFFWGGEYFILLDHLLNDPASTLSRAWPTNGALSKHCQTRWKKAKIIGGILSQWKHHLSVKLDQCHNLISNNMIVAWCWNTKHTSNWQLCF